MSRNYDNWERLVAAVVKREEIWQLCHQDSFSTISSSGYSSHFELSWPILIYADNFEVVRRLRQRNFRNTDLVRLHSATGTKAVIKLLNTGKIREDEFEQHMIVLGNCVHENVATPRAHRFSEMTKLIVYDYYSQGSVFDMLHGGNTNGNRPSWERRVRIAVGAARGIAHIHTQCGGKLAHGNIKSSNIFVNYQDYGCVSDFGLAGIPGMPPKWWDDLEYYTSEHNFKSPSQKSDVYSFGLFLLELVTGKPPVLLPYFVNQLCAFELDTLDFNVFEPIFPITDELDSVGMAPGKFPVDSDLNTWCVEELRRRLEEVAKRCLALLPQDRPTMSQVVIQLQGIRDLNLVHKSGDKKPVWNGFLRFPRLHLFI